MIEQIEMSEATKKLARVSPSERGTSDVERLFAANVGDKVTFAEDKHAYTVQSKSGRFLVCTKPFNPRRTVLYTVVDLEQGVRGTENLIFGLGAETLEQCEQMLARLDSGETEVSYRNRVPLNLVALEARRRPVA